MYDSIIKSHGITSPVKLTTNIHVAMITKTCMFSSVAAARRGEKCNLLDLGSRPRLFKTTVVSEPQGSRRPLEKDGGAATTTTTTPEPSADRLSGEQTKEKSEEGKKEESDRPAKVKMQDSAAEEAADKMELDPSLSDSGQDDEKG